MRPDRPAKPFKLRLPTVAGGLRPGVDLADRDFARFSRLRIASLDG